MCVFLCVFVSHTVHLQIISDFAFPLSSSSSLSSVLSSRNIHNYTHPQQKKRRDKHKQKQTHTQRKREEKENFFFAFVHARALLPPPRYVGVGMECEVLLRSYFFSLLFSLLQCVFLTSRQRKQKRR